MTMNPFSKEKTNCLRGGLAIFILLRHLYLYTDVLKETPFKYVFYFLGFIPVACFFFLSGYGLNESAKKKTTGMLTRVLDMYIKIVCVTFIYATLWLAVDNELLTASNLIKSLSFGGTIVENGWYLQETLLLYIVFFLAYIFFRQNRIFRVLFIFAATILLIGSLYFLKYPIVWYESTICFPLGCLASLFKDKIVKLLQDKYWPIFGLGLILFVAACAGCFILSSKLNIVAAICCLPLLMCALCLISGKSKTFNIFGKISFEIYVFQGLFL